MAWRWDQGRLEYFQYDEIKRIAQGLVAFDGNKLPFGDGVDSLRIVLEKFSDRPFAPGHYKVWRNYGRVFSCQMLAAKVGDILVCTDLCRLLANGSLDVDDYFLHFSNRFYYPSPVFTGYVPNGPQIFPICAILKFLLAKYYNTQVPIASLSEVVDFIIGNGFNGTEPVDRYVNIQPTGNTETSDTQRQIRELLVFISQFSFLKWTPHGLLLDIASTKEADEIRKVLQPVISGRETVAAKEILKIGSNYVDYALGDITAEANVNLLDLEFTEGKKVKVTHLRTERSKKLKDLYYESKNDPQVCNMCTMDTSVRYPWTDRVIELHHLLPLASPVRVERNHTSISDIVGLCPTCHRATHKFYSVWLKDNGLRDFRNYEEARAVYDMVSKSINII